MARRPSSKGCSTNSREAQALDPRRARAHRRRSSSSAPARAGSPRNARPTASSTRGGAASRLDAWLCDLKDMRIGDGLHVFGRSPGARRRAPSSISERAAPTRRVGALDACAGAEMRGLLARARRPLRRAGPAGAPSRGRLDVLPTGRNLYAVDPRAVPTRTAWEIGRRAGRGVRRALRAGPRRLAAPHRARPLGQRDDAHRRRRSRAGACADRRAAALGRRLEPRQRLRDPAARHARPAARRRDVAHLRPVPRRVPDPDRAVRTPPFAPSPRSTRAAEDNPLAGRRRALARIFGAAPGRYGVGLGARIARAATGRSATSSARPISPRPATPMTATARRARRRRSFATRVARRRRLRPCAGHGRARTCSIPTPSPSTRAASPPPPRRSARRPRSITSTRRSREQAPSARRCAQEIARVLRGRAANPRWIAGPDAPRPSRRGGDRRDGRQSLSASPRLTDAVAEPRISI